MSSEYDDYVDIVEAVFVLDLDETKFRQEGADALFNHHCSRGLCTISPFGFQPDSAGRL